MRTRTFHGGRSISLLGTAGQNRQAYFFPGADKTGGLAHPCFPLVPWIVTTEAAPPVAVFRRVGTTNEDTGGVAQAFDLVGITNTAGPPPSRSLRKAGVGSVCGDMGRSRRRRSKRNLGPPFIHSHWPGRFTGLRCTGILIRLKVWLRLILLPL